MNDNLLLGRGRDQSKINLQIDVNQLKSVTCKKCQSEFFEIVFKLKIVPALTSPTGKDEVIAIQTFLCKNCGTEVGQE